MNRLIKTGGVARSATRAVNKAKTAKAGGAIKQRMSKAAMLPNKVRQAKPTGGIKERFSKAAMLPNKAKTAKPKGGGIAGMKARIKKQVIGR